MLHSSDLYKGQKQGRLHTLLWGTKQHIPSARLHNQVLDSRVVGIGCVSTSAVVQQMRFVLAIHHVVSLIVNASVRQDVWVIITTCVNIVGKCCFSVSFGITVLGSKQWSCAELLLAESDIPETMLTVHRANAPVSKSWYLDCLKSTDEANTSSNPKSCCRLSLQAAHALLLYVLSCR